MEGNLLKWTNYWNGWQLRYFVLQDGILSYYNNESEIKSGAKRSFKIFMFDIIVSKHDNTRVDLIVANDQHLYLKACDYKERQKWLVALASQKATHSSKSVSNPLVSSNSPNPADTLPNIDQDESIRILNNSFQQNLSSLDATNMLKIKQSELRLYCDLLTQQTHEMKKLVISSKPTEEQLASDNKIHATEESTEETSEQKQAESSVDGSLSSSFKSTDETQGDDITSKKAEENEQETVTINGDDQESTSIKKMDEITSNINITCDMVIQIIRNVIVLSNTSSNVSQSALVSLLEDANLNRSPQATSNSKPSDLIVDNLSQYRYHLYHPLHSNTQLNQYRRNSSIDTNTLNIEKIAKFDYDTRSVHSLPINRSKNFNFLMQSSKVTHSFTTSNNNNNNNNRGTSYRTGRVKHHLNNLPSLHKIDNNNINKQTFNDNNKANFLKSITSMTSTSHFSLQDSLKETSLVVDPSTTNDRANKQLSTPVDSNTIGTNEKMRNDDEEMSRGAAADSNSIKAKTFFSRKKYCFKEIKLTHDNQIPTEYFLGCCSDIFSLFDNFGSSAFLPVKVDIYGNINKLKQKYSTNSTKYHSLQAIIQSEIDENQTKVRNSATDALLWLKRAIWFLKEFLLEFSHREKPELSECVVVSYQKSLRQYHNWVVRSIFSIALRSLPTTETFLQSLANEPQVFTMNKKQFELEIKDEMKLVFISIDNILKIIDQLYVDKNLEK